MQSAQLPCMIYGPGDVHHLQLTIKQLGAARSRRAVELKLLGDCALWFQAERVRDVDVAAPRRAARTPCHRNPHTAEGVTTPWDEY